MSLQGLDILLKKEEVVATRQSHDFVQQPKSVDDTYRWHVSTYIPMHKGIADKGQLDVAAFAKRLLERVKSRKSTLGYLTADFGYGKTSAGLYIWQQLTENGLVAVPPFQLNSLSDFIDATSGWVHYILDKTKPDMASEVERIRDKYREQTLTEMSAHFGIESDKLEGMLASGNLSLELTPANLTQFFRDITTLVTEAGFDGLVVIPDEIQQYLEPKVKSGTADPIAPLFNLVQTLAGQSDFPFGLLLIIPQKELNLINDQRSDLIDRIRSLSLDLKAIYGRDFPRHLWEKLAKIFEFEAHQWHIIQPETLAALGQISSRDDLSNGPRTVINAFKAVSRHYLDANPDTRQSYRPIDLIDAFLNGVIAFDGRKRIQDSVFRALENEVVKANDAFADAVKLAAAFPIEGCTTELQKRYNLTNAFNELATNDIIISVGDRSKGGVTLRGLDNLQEDFDWFTKTTREFNRNYYEEAYTTIERAVKGFATILIQEVFKDNKWKITREAHATSLHNHTLVFEGTFPPIERQFPARLVQVRILSEEERIHDAEITGEVLLDFRLARHTMVDEQGQRIPPLQLDEAKHRATFTLNLLFKDDRPFNAKLEQSIGRTVMESRLNSLFLLALHHHLADLLGNKQVPKLDEPFIRSQIQPELRRTIIDELLSPRVGVDFGTRGPRLIEEVVARLLAARYGDTYRTLMTVNTWASNLRKYTTALKQLKSPFERQGQTLVRGTKDDIARIFSLAVTGLENYLSNVADLLKLEADFPTKAQIRRGITGAVRFTLHPLEVDIMVWFEQADHTVTIDTESCPALALPDITTRAAVQGYKAIEVEQLFDVLEARDLVIKQRHYLVKRPVITVSTDELVAEIAQFRNDAGFLHRTFPDVTTVKTLFEQAEEFAGHLDQLDKQSGEKLIRLAEQLKQQTKWLVDVRHSCVQQVQQQIKGLVSQLPRLIFADEGTLQHSVEGVAYAAPIDSMRQRLLDDVRQFQAQVQELRAELQHAAESKHSDVSNDDITHLVAQHKQYVTQLDALKRSVKMLTEAVQPLKAWIDLVNQGVALGKRLTSMGPATDTQMTTFQQLADSVVEAFTTESHPAAETAQKYQADFDTIKKQLHTAETIADESFKRFQDKYRTTLTEFGYPRSSPIYYSAQNAHQVYQQLYQQVQQTVAKSVDGLAQRTRTLHNELQNVSGSPALQLLDSDTQHRTESTASELRLYLENCFDPRELYDYLADLDLIRSHRQTDNFSRLLTLIDETKAELSAIESQCVEIREQLQHIELTAEETQVYQALIATQPLSSRELVELRTAVPNLDEATFWRVLRSLWEKQLVQLQVEGKQISSQ